MAENKNVFMLDDGTEEYTVTNRYGEEICKIHIRGGDISILDRYQSLMNDFNSIVAPLANVKFKNDGTTSFEDDWAIVKKAEQEIIDRINELFDMKDAGKLFEKRNAFSTVGGVFYVERVLTMLGDIVTKVIEEETQKSQKRMEKYVKDIDNDRGTSKDA